MSDGQKIVVRLSQSVGIYLASSASTGAGGYPGNDKDVALGKWFMSNKERYWENTALPEYLRKSLNKPVPSEETMKRIGLWVASYENELGIQIEGYTSPPSPPAAQA